ncbi:MAG: hypothetical protein IPN46_12655 [Saprospiraceae bacterium]|nr:hypothetical protein [Saprospiraceae bacterium]
MTTTPDNTDANDHVITIAVDPKVHLVLPWLAADCDGDGNPNPGTDDNPGRTPTTALVNDSGFTAPFGTTTSINILNNDDFLANDGNTIFHRTGGTAGGTIVFDPITGELDFAFYFTPQKLVLP